MAPNYNFVSASQIKLYRECKRKFGWAYLAKIRSPPNEAAQLGIEVDDTQLQPYLRDGRPLDETRRSGLIAKEGLPYLPVPMSPGLRVQKHFEMPSPSTDAFGYQGYMDLYLPDSKAMPLCDGEVPLVGDFKTCKTFDFALSKTGLATDVQAQIYAMNTLVETGARSVDLVWLYLRTTTPYKPKRVHLRVLADDVAEQFTKIDATATEMQKIRTDFAASGMDAESFIKAELPPTASMCPKYKGCFYQSHCNLSPKEISDSLIAEHAEHLTRKPMETETFDLLANLKVRQPVDAPTPNKEPLGFNPPESALPPPEFPAEEMRPLLSIQEAKKPGRPKGSKNAGKETTELADVGEFRSQAFVEFTKTVGEAFLKLSTQLQVSK